MFSSKDRKSWQRVHCYLFEKMMLLMKDDAQPQGVVAQDTAGRNMNYSLKGSVLLPDHLVDVELNAGMLMFKDRGNHSDFDRHR